MFMCVWYVYVWSVCGVCGYGVYVCVACVVCVWGVWCMWVQCVCMCGMCVCLCSFEPTNEMNSSWFLAFALSFHFYNFL